MRRLTSVLIAVFPLTTLFLPLLDRLTLASLLSQSPRNLARVGFRLLILLSAVLVFLVDAAGVEPAVPGAADLQSTGVTNFPTHPKTWWSLIESNYLPTTPLDNGYRVTAGNGEQAPKLT